ncbi:MAG: ammonium transporter [Bacteroidales bacterium]|jgi:Amt family ammonium transporter|nr:ammonium transporter [Bacteroidales bacterium]
MGNITISGLDTVWVLLAAMLVFFMQPGFALVEAGFTRSKNTANILMKNFVDFMIGSFFFWMIGFGIMYGKGNGFFGGIHLFNYSFFGDNNIPVECMFIFQTMFCATSATIVSGAMAERTKFSMYLIFSIVVSMLIYPIEGHWSWGGGWLSNIGFHDFAGSTVVHACGGFIALAGTILLGPRLGKYTKAGDSVAIPGHNLTFGVLGVFILWFGWFGFNPGSQLSASGVENARAISHVMVTTNMAAATGGLSTLFLTWIIYGKPSLSIVCNGILAGLVGITAGCDAVSVAGAAIIGVICGVCLTFSVPFIDKVLHIDDPVGAVSVHGVCGALGTVLTGLFSTTAGLFYGHGWKLLGVQLIGVFAVISWAFMCGFVLFFILKKWKGIRVAPRIEEEGLDVYEHGETAYNN